MKALIALLFLLSFVGGCRSSASLVSDDPCERLPELDAEIAQLRARLSENNQRLDRESGSSQYRHTSLANQLSDLTAERRDVKNECLRSLGSDDVRQILDARARSNAGILDQNISAVMAEIDTVYQATGGDGGFARSHSEMANIFEMEFAMQPPVVYVRTPDAINVSDSGERAFETGSWYGGESVSEDEAEYGGRYAAYWIKKGSAWKIRSEVFVTMYE